MYDYKKRVLQYYSDGAEVSRAEQAGAYGLEFHYTKKLLDPLVKEDSEIIELGCGGGYYGLHYAERCKSYLGIDYSPVNIAAFQSKIDDMNYKNLYAQVGDATGLREIQEDSFDLVLCLGPMYHLNREGRKKCIGECRRICRPGGIIAFAFINKTGAMAKFGASFGWDKVLTPEIDHYVLDMGTDDVNTDVFFYTMPEELEEDTKNGGLETITMAGLDFLIFERPIAKMPEETRKVLFHFMDTMFASPRCAGLANHAMLLCKKT